MSVKLPCHGHACLVGKEQERGLHCEDTISCLSLCSVWILVARYVTGDAGAGKKRPLAGLSIAQCSLSFPLPLIYPLG